MSLLQAISPFFNVFYFYMVLIFHFTCTPECRLQFVSIWTSLTFFCLIAGHLPLNLENFQLTFCQSAGGWGCSDTLMAT